MAEPTEVPTARRTAIVQAAIGVFSRYGLKKTSMDDLARAAGLSRQGLYLHYATKEALFRAAVLQVLGSLRAASEAALANEALDTEERLLAAHEAMHAALIGTANGEHMTELLAAADELLGPAVQELEDAMTNAVAALLRKSGVAARWKGAGVSAKELATQLDLTSRGIKHSVKDVAAYRAKMAVAVRMVCRGGA
jgi:AcrR family transcriptional regulator